MLSPYGAGVAKYARTYIRRYTHEKPKKQKVKSEEGKIQGGRGRKEGKKRKKKEKRTK